MEQPTIEHRVSAGARAYTPTLQGGNLSFVTPTNGSVVGAGFAYTQPENPEQKGCAGHRGYQ